MHLKDLREFIQKIVWLIGFGVTVCDIEDKKMKKLLSQRKIPLFSMVDILLMVAQNAVIHSIF